MENQQRNPNLWDLIITEYKKGESINRLSQKYNKNTGQIRYKLLKANIKVRNVKEGVKDYFRKNTIVLNNDFKATIIGMLLGDGGMKISKNGINPQFIYTDKHKEIIEYTITLFEKNNIKCSSIWQNKSTKAYTFQTETRPEFLDVYNLFYPKETMIKQKQFRKILPDINLTPEILLWWYIGDGSSSKLSKSYNHRGQISCKHFNEFILNQLQVISNYPVKYYNHTKGGTYYFGNKGLINLLNYIGNCPFACYNYKWITRRSETIMEES